MTLVQAVEHIQILENCDSVARFDMSGFKNVLALRAEFGDTGKVPGKPEAYTDLSYYRQALKEM